MDPHTTIEQYLLRLEQEKDHLTRADLRAGLVTWINELILSDFNQLVQVLYRIDVSEAKLKQLLQEHPGTDAAELITDLLITRQQQKIAGKQQFTPNNNISDEERW